MFSKSLSPMRFTILTMTKEQAAKDACARHCVWGGNTTRKAIINVLNRLSADGKKCCSSAEPINNIRHAYDYLIHDTASCRKKGKELYPVEARIEGNNFDIGQLEQLSTKDKQDMLFELVGFIMCEVRDH